MHDGKLHMHPINGSLPLTFNDSSVNDGVHAAARGTSSTDLSGDSARRILMGAAAWVSAFAGVSLVADDSRRIVGVALIALGAGLAVSTWGRQPLRAAFPPDTTATSRRAPQQLALCGVGLALAALSTWAADVTFLRHPTAAFGAPGWLWMLGMAILIVSTACWPRGDATADASPQRADIAELLIFTALLAAAFALRLWDLANVPFAIHPDEINTGRVAHGYLTAWLSAPTSIFRTTARNVASCAACCCAR